MSRPHRLYEILIVLLLLPVSLFAQPEVVSVTPTAHATRADPATSLSLTFNQPLDPLSVDAADIQLFGRWSGVHTAQVVLTNSDMTIEITPDQPFLAGEVVTAGLSRTITGLSGDTITRGWVWQFWIGSDSGRLDQPLGDTIHIRAPGEPRVRCYGGYAGDINQDGFTDLSIVNEEANHLRILLNDGTGHYSGFTTLPFAGTEQPSPSEGADFDGDGLTDLVVTTAHGNDVRVMFGDGAGSFGPATVYNMTADTRSVSVGDVDSDGDADIAFTQTTASNVAVLYNDGTGSFPTMQTFDANGAVEWPSALCDMNNDGALDLVVGSQNSNNMAILLGDGLGDFTLSTSVAAGGRPWMIATADMNGDGFADVVSANSSTNNVSILFGDGAGAFSGGQAYPDGLFPLAIDLGDLDGDGDIDAVSSNFSSADFTVFENDGSGVFVSSLRLPASTAGSCALLHDRDNDGDVDISAVDELDDILFLFDNSCCEGMRGDLNGDGVDADPVDLSELVDYLFSGAATVFACNEETDLDGDGGTMPGPIDLAYLVDFLFNGGNAPPSCY